MTVYFMGGEVGSFTPADSQSYEGNSGAAPEYDASFCRTAMTSNGGSTSSTSVEFSLPDEFWFHADIADAFNLTSSFKYFTFKTSSTDVLRLGYNSSGMKVQALISAVWTDVVPLTTVSMTNARQTVDMHVTGNSGTGEIALYIAGVKRDEQTANLTAVTGIETVRIGPGSTYGGSQFVIADEPTIGWRLMTYVPTGAGATGDWTGDYSAIDEKPNNDAEFMNSGTANQVELCTTTPVGSITGYTPRAVGVYCRARCGAGGPQNLQLALRSSGTTYFSGDKALDVGYASMGHIWNTDPATSAAFLAAAIATLQPGVKSIA